MLDLIKHVTDDSFETDVIKSSKPVLLDFWAPWCGPCKSIAPILEELAAEIADKITIVKVNVDDNPKTPIRYGVRGIPTLMLFADGNVLSSKVGAVSKTKLLEFINEHVN